MESEEAAVGWRAAEHALQEGQAQFTVEVGTQLEGEVWATCPQGGQIRVAGVYDDDREFELTTAFTDCGADGVRLDGELELSAGVDVGEDAYGAWAAFTGELVFAGEVDGACSVDMTAFWGVQDEGDVWTAGASYEGHVCGVEASAVVRVQVDD